MEYRPDYDIRERDDVYPPSDDSILLIESLQERPEKSDFSERLM